MSVYVIRAGTAVFDPVKVGFTVGNVLDRIKGVQTGCPVKVELVLCVDGNRDLEQAIHVILAPYAMVGEWFADSSGKIDLSDWLLRLHDPAWRSLILYLGSKRIADVRAVCDLIGLVDHAALLRHLNECNPERMEESLRIIFGQRSAELRLAKLSHISSRFQSQGAVACPVCDSGESQIINSRPHKRSVRRRRECVKCHRRWSTMEVQATKNE